MPVFRFRPERVAYLEAAGWRAYYDRAWPRLLSLLVTLCQEQFRIPFPMSLLAAYYATRAAAAWAPVDHDEAKVKDFYAKFYRLARRYSNLRFDPVQVAEWELRYNEVHRRLSGRPDKAEFVETMTGLHGALFGVSEDVARKSAGWRVSANNTVDRITSKQSTDVEGDWAALEADLRRCYGLIAARLAENAEGAGEADGASSGANDYHFVTHWRLLGTVEEAAEILSRADDLPRWWPAVYLGVEVLAPGDEAGVGREVALYTKGWLPYTLRWQFRTTESRYPHGFTLEANGDFVGRGVWTLEQDGPYVNLTYDWRIRAEKPLLRNLSFLLKPIFAANHYWAMAKGEESLRLEMQRRRATSDEARKRVPAPPGPTPTAAQLFPFVAPFLALPLAVFLARGLRRVGNRRGTPGLGAG
ncbi:MAG TPA: hypothetical protein VFZ25_06500 [Chloroflexota bacterium]|nr:hypothetical protein [Chloroflexota bacterium]